MIVRRCLSCRFEPSLLCPLFNDWSGRILRTYARWFFAFGIGNQLIFGVFRTSVVSWRR